MKHNLPFLRHILDEINFLIKESESVTYDDFISNELLKRGCSRSIEVIGEAVKNLSTDFKKKNKNIPWKEMAAMRDKIIHEYFGVKWEVVWSVLKNNVPELKPKIEEIIKEQEQKVF